MSAALYFHPEAYTVTGPKLMGRNAAGESFLRGYLLHCKTSEFWIQVQKEEHAEYFASVAQSLGRREPVRVVQGSSIGALAQPGTVHYPGPGIGEYAFKRAAAGHRSWSLCGLTHTTSSAGAMDALSDLITSPVQPWDALICTSHAVKSNVERLLQAQANYLSDRLGITRLILPQMPVIPLGTHTEDFFFNDQQRLKARQELGLDCETRVVLFMGRLSFHAKAHPLAMYQALQAASSKTKKKVLLIECGWHANDYIEKAYREAALQACPDVRILTMDGRKADNRQQAWASADIFCSLSDNIQETFGITPIEAMAAGLPVIVSDWDGYKDTVRHNVDGFRIPTMMPADGLGRDLAHRHALHTDTYDMFCGHTCSLVAIDVPKTVEAFVNLFESEHLCKTMGEAGRARARELYDWKAVIQQYEQLWGELSRLRTSESTKVTQLAHPWAARMDPFFGFSEYPSEHLTAETRVVLVDATAELSLARAQRYIQLAMVNFAKYVLPTEDELKEILYSASDEPQSAFVLVSQIAEPRRAHCFRALTWLIKLNILKVVR